MATRARGTPDLGQLDVPLPAKELCATNGLARGTFGLYYLELGL